MTCIIAIETATEACSAALLLDKNGKQTLYKRFQLAPREHTKLILPMLDQVLADANLKLADVDAIAFGRGPGAFTGLRIASGIAQGIALSVDKPTIAVSSLMAMALAAEKEISNEQSLSNTIFVAIDARMGEVYWAEYSVVQGEVDLVGKERLSTPEEMFLITEVVSGEKTVTVIGSGWDVYIEDYKNNSTQSISINHIVDRFPAAEEISQLALVAFEKGECQSIEEAQPVYLRNNVAEKSKKAN